MIFANLPGPVHGGNAGRRRAAGFPRPAARDRGNIMQPSLTIAIGADHGGPALKASLAAALRAAGHTVLDMGTDGTAAVDYPDFARAVCAAVESSQARFGVLICGTGIGMSIAANRHKGIRCGLCTDVTMARLTREHNDANVLALGARIIGDLVAQDILATFIATAYEGGRHDRRLAKLMPT
jgi:ribose 5-phosphate isomerase B